MKYECGSGRTALCYEIQRCGDDLRIHISGGVNHLGAVSAARNGAVTTHVFPHHEEQQLTEAMAQALSIAFPGNIVVSAGVHLDGITASEIARILFLNEEAVCSLISLLKQTECEEYEN